MSDAGRPRDQLVELRVERDEIDAEGRIRHPPRRLQLRLQDVGRHGARGDDAEAARVRNRRAHLRIGNAAHAREQDRVLDAEQVAYEPAALRPISFDEPLDDDDMLASLLPLRGRDLRRLPRLLYADDDPPPAPPGLPEPEVRAVVLTDAQVDHVGGLLSLRDGAPIDLYATPAVFEQLTTELPVLPVLQHYCAVHWHVVPVAGDRRVASFRVDGMPTLQFTAVATQSPLPPHLASTTRGEQPQVGDSIALAVQDLATGQRVFCAPGLSQIGATEFEWMREADCLLLDNLLPDTGMAAGDQPWLDLLRGMPARHKVLFADEPDTEGDAALAEEGIALAYDGMEIEL